MSRIICTLTVLCLLSPVLSTNLSLAQDETDAVEDTSSDLPRQFSDYLIGSKTLSPDKKFAVIYPKMEVCTEEPKKGSENRCKDYLVALSPFRILMVLETDSPE